MASRADAGSVSEMGVPFVTAFHTGNSDDDDGVATPEGFHNTPDQWHSAAAQKKRGVGNTLADAATQRDSQATQVATEVQSFDTQAVYINGGAAWTHGPSFVDATGSLSGDGSSADRKFDDVDEDETQIIMSLSQDRGAMRQSARRIEEEELEAVPPLPPTHGDAVVTTGEGSDVDSDMSDDMLEQDGDVNGLSSIAKNFQLNEAELLQEKKAVGNVYKPRMPFQFTPPASIKGDASVEDSSGAETEVEEEPETTTQTFGTNASKAEVGGVPPALRASATKKFLNKRSVSEAAVSQPEGRRPKRFSELERSASCTDVEETPERSKRARVLLGKPSDSKPPLPGVKRLTLDTATKGSDTQSTSSSSQETNTAAGADAESTAVLDAPSLLVATPTTPTRLQASTSKGSPRQSRTSPTTTSRTTPKTNRKRKATSQAILDATEEAEQETHPSVPDAISTPMPLPSPAIRIMFTGLDGTIPELRDKVKKIVDAVQEDDEIERVTHLVAPQNQLKRTVKLLCGISCCDHILDERWLDESARSGFSANEALHCLKDTTAEAKWQFSLYRTMYMVPKPERRTLFDGLRFFITNHKSILPPVKDLVKIVACAGGHAEMKGAATAQDIVITSETALPLAATKKALTHAASGRIYTPEFILSSILQQRIDYDANRLAPLDTSETPSKKKRGRK